MMMTLSQLPLGKDGLVKAIELSSENRTRLEKLGLWEGRKVTLLLKGSFGDPLLIRTGKTTLCLRQNTAQQIRVQID